MTVKAAYLMTEFQFCRRVVDATNAAYGGTFQVSSLEQVYPSRGYLVGTYGVAIPASEFKPRDVFDFLQETGLRRAGSFIHLGTWLKDDGLVYMDVIVHLDSLESALAIARLNEQTEIWDCARDKPLPVAYYDSEGKVRVYA